MVANARHADKLISDVEAILSSPQSRSPFPKYVPDASPHQARLILSHLNRFRGHLAHALQELEITEDPPKIGMIHSIRVALTFLRIAVQEMSPEQLRGYGPMDPDAAKQLRGLTVELEQILSGVEEDLRHSEAGDLSERLARFEASSGETATLSLLNQIVERYELAQFRAQLLDLAEKLESRQFEIAIFGRVSSGKSTLLNRFLGEDILPVGVNPITAVPTRIVAGAKPQLDVAFVDRRRLRLPLDAIADYVTEEQNPGNVKEVTRVVVELPSPRLHDGLVLVDTPGLGSLATKGGEETLAYLPRADFAIVLISAASPLNDDDLTTIRALRKAGIPISVLLSKADLIPASEVEKAVAYTHAELGKNAGIATPVFAVSSSADHASALETWFAEHLAPLAAGHREQALLAARRKTGILRESVMAALQARLESATMVSPEQRARLEEAEAEMREAASEIEEYRQFSLPAVDGIRGFAREAILRIADQILADKGAAGGNGQTFATIAFPVAESVAREASSPVVKRLRRLARDLGASLVKTASALGTESSENGLESAIRGIPRFDLALPNPPLPQPGLLRLWPRLAARWMRRRVSALVLPVLEQAFASYSRAMEVWVRHVLAELSMEFHRQADVYRSEITAKLGKSPSGAARAEEIRSDLERLAATGADPTGSPQGIPSD